MKLNTKQLRLMTAAANALLRLSAALDESEFEEDTVEGDLVDAVEFALDAIRDVRKGD